MQILTPEETANTLRVPSIESFFGDWDWQYPDPVPSYFLPKDSGAKVALARMLTSTFLELGPAVLWITGTGIWPSSEHMDLFARYRLSHGENRTILEAPVHIFEVTEMDTFVSFICLGLFFVWDFEIASQDRSLAMTISHDEWIEYRFAKGHEDLALYFEKHFDRLTRKANAQ
jgi:hypothetical protein